MTSTHMLTCNRGSSHLWHVEVVVHVGLGAVQCLVKLREGGIGLPARLLCTRQALRPLLGEQYAKQCCQCPAHEANIGASESCRRGASCSLDLCHCSDYRQPDTRGRSAVMVLQSCICSMLRHAAEHHSHGCQWLHNAAECHQACTCTIWHTRPVWLDLSLPAGGW